MPESLGRLRRVRRIGAGGFASVWLYRDDQLDSFVAVKALADNWAQQLDIRERFLDEARIIRRAVSDHVVEVHDIGETDDGTPYFVMTYADQGTLADLSHDGPVDPETAVDLVEQACRGVADLHAAGVLHRDVKPANLLLRTGPDGGHRLLVADLGLAKATMYASGLTQVVGSPGYMAPEQAIRGGGVDERADVHALGAVTFHLLTGRSPLDLQRRDSTLPPPFEDIVGRAVQHDPAARWPDPMAFAAALRQAVATPGAASPSRRTKRRVAVGATAGAAILAAGVSIVVLTGEDGGEPAASEPPSDAERSGRPTGDYCKAFARAADAMAMVGPAPEVGQGARMIESVHAARLAAPPAIEDAWASFDDPLQEFVAVLEKTDTTWAEFEKNKLDPDVEDEIALAGTEMELKLEAHGNAVAFAEIRSDAAERCDIPPGDLLPP